ncbi:MAG: hypothetical protein WC365_01340 [Candidatus Babeliales bacterium]|jgi:hypothetical protein
MYCDICLNGGGSAFQNRDDIGEILLNIRNRIVAGEQDGDVRDLNGNDIGWFMVGGEE